MGRGRAKAKQTKVARELKYSSGGTDLDALRKELASAATTPPDGTAPSWTEPDSDEDDDLDGSYGASGSL